MVLCASNKIGFSIIFLRSPFLMPLPSNNIRIFDQFLHILYPFYKRFIYSLRIGSYSSRHIHLNAFIYSNCDDLCDVDTQCMHSTETPSPFLDTKCAAHIHNERLHIQMWIHLGMNLMIYNCWNYESRQRWTVISHH